MSKRLTCTAGHYEGRTVSVIGVKRNFPDVLVTQFWHNLAHTGQVIEHIRLGRNVLCDLPGVMAGIVGNEVMDRSKIGLGS